MGPNVTVPDDKCMERLIPCVMVVLTVGNVSVCMRSSHTLLTLKLIPCLQCLLVIKERHWLSKPLLCVLIVTYCIITYVVLLDAQTCKGYGYVTFALG